MPEIKSEADLDITLRTDLPKVRDFAYDARKVVLIGYVNHRGVVSTRRIVPDLFAWGSNDYHKEKQWLLDAFDVEKREWRTFASKDILFWRTA